MQCLKILTFDITASILLKRKECGIAELQEMDKGTLKGIASFKRNKMKGLRLEAVSVVSRTLMESLVITWWLLLSCPELKAKLLQIPCLFGGLWNAGAINILQTQMRLVILIWTH
jgi:hypothetical protein